MLEFITRMGYHFRWKIGRKSVEIGEICKHVTCGRKNGRWGTIGRKLEENELKIESIRERKNVK